MVVKRWQEIDRMLGAMDLFWTRMPRLWGELGYDFRLLPEREGIEGWPRTNLYDQGGQLLLTAELPGVAKEELKVRVQGNYLEIGGVRPAEVPEGYTVQRQERGAVSFTRSFTLPAEIDANKVEALLVDGILRLTLPKAEAVTPKQIAIN